MNWFFLILGFACLITGAALVGVAENYRRRLDLSSLLHRSILVEFGVGLFLLLLGELGWA